VSATLILTPLFYKIFHLSFSQFRILYFSPVVSKKEKEKINAALDHYLANS
jgi:hypothetical protein